MPSQKRNLTRSIMSWLIVFHSAKKKQKEENHKQNNNKQKTKENKTRTI